MTEPYNISTAPIQTGPVAHPVAKRSYSRIYGRNEILDGEYKLYQKLLGEFLGTALFVWGVISPNVFFQEYSFFRDPLYTTIPYTQQDSIFPPNL